MVIEMKNEVSMVTTYVSIFVFSASDEWLPWNSLFPYPPK